MIWAEAEGCRVTDSEGRSYIDGVLRHRRDEATIMGPPTETMGLPLISTGSVDVVDEDDDVDWRDLV